MEGFLEILCFLVFLYWFWPSLFTEGASRANKMVDIITNRMFDVFSRLAPSDKHKNDSLSSINKLKRFSLQQQQQKLLSKANDIKAVESYLYSIKENTPPVMPPASRPLMGLTCYSCTPISRESLINKVTQNLGLKNILCEHPSVKNPGFLQRTFSHLSQVFACQLFDYTQVTGSVLQDIRVRSAVGKTAKQQFEDANQDDEDLYQQIYSNNEKRAEKLLWDMRSTLSNYLLKLTSWVLYKLLPCFLTSVVVHSGQIEMLKEAGKSGLPLIFLPLHRSHLDYVMISFILQNNNIRCPLIAAGDNLRMPVFGSLLRGLGAFYIKRRMDPIMGQKDHVYKAILHSYMNAGLKAGHNVEFFLEGGRTRTGKPLMPKYGIFSVVLDAFMNDTIEDALLIPVSINYEKLVDGNFVREQLGQPKQMETFSSAMKSIWQVLNSNYGMVRIDFNQPFSLRELTKTFNNGKIQNDARHPKKLKTNPSTSSLYGTDLVSEEHKHLVEKLSKHVIFDCARSTSVMSTNAVAFLLLHKFRDGVKLDELTTALDELRNELSIMQKDVGFTGDSLDVISYAIDLLGPGLVRKEKVLNEYIIKPMVKLPNVIELNYYSNTLTTFYCLEAVIALVLRSLDIKLGLISEGELIDSCMDVCELLQYEFIFCKPCQTLESALVTCFEDMVMHREIIILQNGVTADSARSRRLALQFLDDDEEQYTRKLYRINKKAESQEYISFMSGLLMPLIESYSVTAFCMNKLIGRSLLENDLIKETLEEMRLQLSSGCLNYDESVSSDSIKNALKLFQKLEFLECHNENKLKLYYLRDTCEDDQSVKDLCGKIDKYRYSFQQS